tara:strand:- start:2588 stop:3496 length:909 start_codon:yes stop_codon:yes gene_type:complete
MINKPKIGINKKDLDGGCGGTLGAKFLLEHLSDTKHFDVVWHYDRLKTMRGERATIIYYNDSKIYLDLWEYATPTHTPNVVNAKFDLIIKLQHNSEPIKRFHRYWNRKKILNGISEEDRVKHYNKIVPWTFFPSKMFLPLTDEQLEPLEAEQVGFFCGKSWNSRSKMKASLLEQGFEYIESNQERRKGKRFTDEEYLQKMRTSKYGFVFPGRSTMITDPKNRREIDYMMLKKPLVLSYKPHYYDPLIPGEHYIYIDENTKLEDLDKYDADKIAKNGHDWYLKNASSDGIVESFVRIINERLV